MRERQREMRGKKGRRERWEGRREEEEPVWQCVSLACIQLQQQRERRKASLSCSFNFFT